jgi:hypothetical protein
MTRITDLDLEIDTGSQHESPPTLDYSKYGRGLSRSDLEKCGLLPHEQTSKTGDASEVLTHLLEKMDAVLDELRKPPLPLEHALWSSDQIAAWLGLSKQTVEVRVVTRKDFPAALRPVETKQAQRRWFASDVMKWARSTAGSLPGARPGRRRKSD